MTKVDASFGGWLKSRRKTLDLTQEELAQQVGCATVTIRKIESNALKPSTQIAQRLAQCCNVPAEEQEAFVRFARSEQTSGHVWVDKAPGAAAVKFESDRPANNLTDLPSPLIGREDDVAQIRQRLLNENVRLLTLIGPPGVGKTRLAMQVASEALDRFRDGVFLVSLAPISSPEQVLLTIAHTLGLKESGMRKLSEELKNYLYDKELLLVLDNFEQVLEAGPAIDALLQTCYGLKALVTSREGLRLRRERRFNVAPLPLPAGEALSDPQALAAIPAVALFVERAQAANSSFELDQYNAADVAAVCVQLDGLPLSIELIAARSMLLSPRAMLGQLDRQLAVLTSKSFDHPQRQRTLRDAIRWSHDLLDATEQELFARLGVFPASFTLSAAEAIGDSADLPWSVLDGLAALVDKSLLIARTDARPEMRFEMLQVLREYARESLSRHPARDIWHQNHADYYLGMTLATHDDLIGAQQGEMLLQIEQETYNVQAALSWFAEHQQTAKAMDLASGLADYWYIRGYISEGRRWLERMVLAADQAVDPIEPRIWIDTLNAAGFLAYHQSDYATSRQLFSRSLALIEQSNDQMALARVFNNLGLIAQWQGDCAGARQSMERSLELWRSVGESVGVANAKSNLGMLSLEIGDYPAAQNLLEESLGLWQEIGNQRGISTALVNLGRLAFLRGRPELALARLEESYALNLALGNKTGIISAQIYRAEVLIHRDDLERAEQELTAALALARDIGNKHMVSHALRGLGRLAGARGDLVRSESFYQEALTLCRLIGYRRGIAACSKRLAMLAWRQGQPAARDLAAAAVAEFRALDQRDGLLGALETLARIVAEDEPERAMLLWHYADAQRAALHIPRLPLDESIWEEARAALLARCGPAAWKTSSDAARAADLDRLLGPPARP
jgi:predicted ATPase/DNA-binding XRE family transcriptional regulator